VRIANAMGAERDRAVAMASIIAAMTGSAMEGLGAR